MKLIQVFNQGKILHKDLYTRLKKLDFTVFYKCGNEFLKNRDWWVVVDNSRIIAYCGCLYSDGICIFVRAWVHAPYRGRGLQTKMIKTRLRAAKKKCTAAITYTTADNIHSIINLIRNHFRLYIPEYSYAGKDKYYFKYIL